MSATDPIQADRRHAREKAHMPSDLHRSPSASSPAEDALYPAAEVLAAVARCCGWPAVEVDAPTMGRVVRIAPRRLAWEGFARWADGPARVAAWEALERWEREMQAELHPSDSRGT